MRFVCMFLPALIAANKEIKNKMNIVEKAIIYSKYCIYINLIINLFLIVLKNGSLAFEEMNSNKFYLFYILIGIVLARILPSILKKIIKHKNQILKKISFLLAVVAQFCFFDIIIRYIVYKSIGFFEVSNVTPNLFTISYGLLMGIILILIPRCTKKFVLSIGYFFNLIIFITNYMLLAIKKEAFAVRDLQIAGEGFEYISFILGELKISFFIIIIISFLIFLVTFKLIKNADCNYSFKKKIVLFIISIISFVGLRVYSLNLLEDYHVGGWDDVAYPRYYTDNFINSRNSLSVLGLYEYLYADAKNYIKESNTTFGSNEQIDEIISNSKLSKDNNEMTGIFKDKNLIMIMMESLDNLVVDEEIMPTLYKLENSGWNFTKRYSQLNTGGSTIATEYTTLSGLYYLFDKKYDSNTYSEALPSIFTKNGYKTTSFHENKSVYYNRRELHKSFGFDESYFLYDTDLDYKIYDDSQFFEDDVLYEKVISKDSKFMSFIITIESHGPYKNNIRCPDDIMDDEAACFRHLASETDQMLEVMLERLENDGLLDDTVIILYSDHAAYTYNYTDEELQSTYDKIDNDYSVKNIPFVIYNSEIDPITYDDIIINDIDFVPTILNLFGIDYDPNYYVGRDIFSNDHKNVCIFNDYRWYDGERYSETSEQDDYFKSTTSYVKEVIDFSKMLVENDYYRNYNVD